FQALLDDLCEPRVRDFDLAHLSALRAEFKMQLLAAYAHMAGGQCGEAVGIILSCICRISYTDGGAFHKPHGKCKDFLTAHRARIEIPPHGPAKFRKRFPELDQTVKFSEIAHFAPPLVVKVL